MNDDLAQELRAFEGSEALANGDFSVCYRGAVEIKRLLAACSEAERTNIQASECHSRETRRADALQKRIAELEAALIIARRSAPEDGADSIEAQAAYIRELRECLVQYVELDWPKAEQHKRARDILMQTWEYKRSRMKQITGEPK